MSRANQISGIISLIIKILLLVAVIATGVFVYQTCAGTPIVQKIDKTLPDKVTAPFEVQTMSKIYLSRSADLNEDGSVTMKDWYERDGVEWVLHQGAIVLPKLLRPKISER